MQNRYMTDSEMKGMNELVQKLMKEQGLSYSSIAMGSEVGDYISQVSPTQRQAQAKTAVLNQGASAAAAQAGQGGDTNVTVVAPTTANSTTTNQNINPNPLMSQNPRTAIGVDW